MTRDQKLERFAERELKRVYTELIIDDEHGGYVAFGRYHVKPNPVGFAVYYHSDDLVSVFSSKRTAMSWCVADHLQQHRLAQNIRILDNKKQTLTADIHCRNGQADGSNRPEFREMVRTKLAPKIENLTLLNQELEKCLNSAKYLQLRGFAK
jgi:hypothetical protein